MLKLLKKSKFFIIFIITINISSLVASEIRHSPTVQSQYQSSFANKGDIIKQLYNDDGLLLYDSVIRLLDELENGDLDDVYTEEDWYKINRFLAFLARQGVTPNTTEEEKAELEQDIQELLDSSENNITFENTSYKSAGLQILPAVYYGQADIILCKSWIKKQYKHVGKFVKEHKKAIIIGTVVVVATLAVVAAVVTITTAAAAAATTTTTVVTTIDSSESESNNKDTMPLNTEPIFANENPTQSVDNAPSNIAGSSLPQSFGDQISNVINENNLISKPADHEFYNDYERYIGSMLAHEALQNIPGNLNLQDKNYEDIIIQGHGKIDSAFATNQAPFYIEENNILGSHEKNFQENFFYLQGERALKDTHYNNAIENFGKALEVNPNNHNIYLDRAYAYLQDGQFDHSLNDYNVYTEQKNVNLEKSTTLIDCVDFSMGVTTGITKGAVESGKQLIAFAAGAIAHPAKTYVGFVDSIQMISDLAKDNEWKTLSEIMIPEVRALINEWEVLSPKEKGEKSGYIIGKYGADILIPVAAAKAISQGMKGAKELAVIAKNLQNAEKVIVLEALAETGGRSGTFAETVYAWKTAEQILPHSSGILKRIKETSSILTKTDILNIIKRNGELIGKKGASDFIRLFEGGQNEAMQVFKELTKSGKLVRTEKNITIYKISDDIYITYRQVSTSGPPTIDIKLPEMEHNIKFKFLEEK